MLASIGLFFVILAWIYQLFVIKTKKDNHIQPVFVLTYAVGVLFLISDGFSAGMMTLAYLNLGSFIISIAVFVLLIKSR